MRSVGRRASGEGVRFFDSGCVIRLPARGGAGGGFWLILTQALPGNRGPDRITVGGDKGFDTADFVADLRALNVTPHIAQDTTNRASAIDGRTTRHPGYAISQKKRKLVEEPFGWGKTIGGLARPMLRGVRRLDFKFALTLAAYDLIKLPKLLAAPA